MMTSTNQGSSTGDEPAETGLSRRGAVQRAGALALAFAVGPRAIASRAVRAQVPGTPGQVTTNDGVTLHYLDWGGKGEPLLFLTGYGAPAHVFDSLAPKFTNAFRVIALTRRGRAPSQTPSSGYDFDTLTADVKGVLDAL